MKILERKEQPTAIVNCSHCGSKLEIERSDIRWYRNTDGIISSCVTCAVCYKDFDVDGYIL